MSLTNFRSKLIFASYVVGTRTILIMSEFLLGGVLFFVHYNGKYWYLYFCFPCLVRFFNLARTLHIVGWQTYC